MRKKQKSPTFSTERIVRCLFSIQRPKRNNNDDGDVMIIYSGRFKILILGDFSVTEREEHKKVILFTEIFFKQLANLLSAIL